jgi:hypothetical protein
VGGGNRRLATALYDHFHDFTVCVVAMTVTNALILPAILLVPRHLTATPDGVAAAPAVDLGETVAAVAAAI